MVLVLFVAGSVERDGLIDKKYHGLYYGSIELPSDDLVLVWIKNYSRWI